MSLPKTIRTIPQDRTAMPEQAPDARVRNFFEVALGYGVEHALREAERCLDCKDPKCLRGCPVSVDIPGFLRKLSEHDYHGAYDLLARTNVLPAICGRVCPQEDQCEGMCTVGDTLEPVAIGRLERWLGDHAIELGWSGAEAAPSNGFKVGIVGSGPAGIACAADLARLGCEVTIYEALHAPGGVLRYGIPEFRLPNRVIDAEIAKLERLGVRIECNTLVGRLFTIEQMRNEQGFDAVFIATGAGFPNFMGIPGEGLNGVVSANELLTRCNLMQAGDFPDHDTPLGLGRRVAVIGAGNTAMDALRVSRRLGAEAVLCVYRRSRTECPARAEELHHAEQEGVEFHWLTNPVEILADAQGDVRALRCQRMQLAEADASGRRRPEPVPDSDFELPVDMVVYAIGTNANPIIGQTSGIARNRWGYLQANEALETSLAGVYAGGDIVTGSATVILAMGAGRRAARSIARQLGLAEPEPSADPRLGVFGIEPGRRTFARLRAGLSEPQPSAAMRLVPAALRALLPIEHVRHPFPVLLMHAPRPGEPAVCSLRAAIDAAIAGLREQADDAVALERCALALEARMRELAQLGPEPICDLEELATRAEQAWLALETSEERRQRAQKASAAVRGSLPQADVVGCTQAGAELLLAHLREATHNARLCAVRAELAALDAALYTLDQCDFMTTAEAYSQPYLSAALGPAAQDCFDVAALSRLLLPLRAASAEPPRRARIRALRAELGRARLLALPSSAWVFRGCSEALAALEPRLAELELLLTAAEQAHLETRGPAAQRDASLHVWKSAGVAARALLPRSLVLIDADRLEHGERERLLALLATDLPVKVLCTSAALAAGDLPSALAAHGSLPGGHAAMLAALCRGLPGVHIVQAALSELPACAADLTQAMEADGPALIAVYTGEYDPGLPPYLAAAAACAARVFPTFVRAAGAQQLALEHNPQPEAAWPSASFRSEDAALQRLDVEEAFTAGHLAACWTRLNAHMPLVDDAAGCSEHTPLAAALAEPCAPAQQAYVSVVDTSDHLLHALVPPKVIAYTQQVAQHWRSLQAVARTADQSPPAQPMAAEAPEPEPESTPSGAAYVETARCSSCDECIKRAPGLFAYDADKRAVLRSPRSGSYRELVEAAEHCKMAIIHPGQPWDQSEPDLGELLQRAALFA